LNSKNILTEIDWSFSNFSNTGLHSSHWYPATYISAIPGTLIPALCQKGATVLDPFGGSGTTGLESLRLGNKFIGFDTNPVAILIAESKLLHPGPKKFLDLVTTATDAAQYKYNHNQVPNHPQEEELRSWYHPDTIVELNAILYELCIIKNDDYKKCALATFSSILKSTCSQGKHWGWVCDNVKPKSGEIVYKNAFTSFITACQDYIQSSGDSFESIQYLHKGITRAAIRSQTNVVLGDCVANMENLASDSIDLIMTSPPYYGVADYIKSQRLSYLWFDIEELSSTKLGFRNFSALRALEKGARSHRHRKNSWQQYIDFIQRFFIEAHRILNVDAHMALVVGESSARTGTTDTLINIAKDVGFSLDLRKQRDIRANRRRLMAKVKGEDVLIFSKTI
jgi:DNA modification methylase